jgi:sec-independent protein translocase protein TatB
VFGLTFEKLLIIGVIAVFLVGPEKLPHYAAQLGRLVRSLRTMATGAKERLKDEMGDEFDEVEWKKLDPRQYDPRRIIREALLDDGTSPAVIGTPVISSPVAPPPLQSPRSANAATPYDGEAT